MAMEEHTKFEDVLITTTVNKSPKDGARKELMNVVFLSCMFMLSFSTIQALHSLQSSLNHEGGLGVFSLASLYAVIIISGLFTPVFIRAIGTKRCFILGWLSHCVYIAANFYPSWKSLLPASLFVGLFQSLLWVSQVIYVTSRALNYAKLTCKSIIISLSLINGIFLAMSNLSMVIGNLISSLVLKHSYNNQYENRTTDSMESWFDQCGANDCPGSNFTALSVKFTPDPTTILAFLGIFMAISLLCLILTIIFLQPLDKAPQLTFVKTLNMCYRLFWTDIKIYLLIPFTMSQSFIAVIVLAEFTKSYISCTLGVTMVGFIMASYGLTSVVFAAVQSQLVKYTGRRVLLGVAATCQLCMLMVLLFWHPDPKHPYVYFFVAALFGVGEGLWHPQAFSFVAMVFGERRDAAFYNLQAWKACGYTIQFLVSPFLCVSTKIILVAVFFVIALLLYTIVEVLYAKDVRAKAADRSEMHKLNRA